MATISQNPLIPTVKCRIVHKESGVGIPDLQLVFFDALKQTPSGSTAGRRTVGRANYSNDVEQLMKSSSRIGSVLTDSEGSAIFKIQLGDAPLKSPFELLMVILSPDEPKLKLSDRILHYTTSLQLGLVAEETYLVKLSSDLLAAKNVSVPNTLESDDEHIQKLERNIESGKKFFAKKQALFKNKIIDEHAQYQKKRQDEFITPFTDAVSKVPPSVREKKNFVKNGKSVGEATFSSIRDRVKDTFTPGAKSTSVKGFLYLSKQELSDFEPYKDGSHYVLPDDIIKERIVSKIFGDFGEGSQNEHLANLSNLNGSVTTPSTEPFEAPAEGATDLHAASLEDIPIYVAEQLGLQSDIDEAIDKNRITFEKRPTDRDIDDKVSSALFKKGPADTPAYHEFHSLKIAFENIWQETMDLGLINKAELWYDQVVANGGDATVFKPFFLGFVGNALDALAGLGGDAVEWAEQHFGNSGDDGNRSTSGGTTTIDNRTSITNELTLEFPEAIGIWGSLTQSEKKVLMRLAELLAEPFAGYFKENQSGTQIPRWQNAFNSGKREMMGLLRAKGKNIVDAAQARIDEKKTVHDDFSSLKRASQLAEALKASLSSPYSFKHYAANQHERSVNFGLLISYQQKWEPLDYQAGELVSTIPLAPKESRKFSKKITVKKNRTQKEIEENLRIIRSENQDSTRAESEIITKAHQKSSIDSVTTASGDFSIGPLAGSGSTSLTFHTESEKDSQQNKKNFREAVLKASQEFKNERKIEITTDDTSESENIESGEIFNPNDELTVTYLFYELQRRFRISERLYRLRPLVLVAQELPSPNEIDNPWIITHDWMIKRALLDDSFRAGIDYVYTINGELLMLDELKKTVSEQRKVVKDLRQSVRFMTQEVAQQNALMMRSIDRQAKILEDGDIWDGVPVLGSTLNVTERALDGIGNLLGMGGGDNPEEASRIRAEAVSAAYERAERERRELLSRLESETTNLNGMTGQLALKQKQIIEKEIHIERLKVHIKENILYYMQAIWTHEHRDQRFFRLMDTKVPTFKGQYKIKINTTPEPKRVEDLGISKTRHAYWLTPEIEVAEATLKEVADLDQLLGFKGNYMVFPLLKSNILTDYMMAPYVNSEFGLLDPDSTGNWTLDEFEQYVERLKDEMGEHFSEIEEDVQRLYAKILQDPLRNGDTITVPTGSLFIEALPGSHTILEYFKLAHRYEDVKKVQAENRWAELNNARLAARIITGDYDEAKTDKRIILEGPVNPTLDVDN